MRKKKKKKISQSQPVYRRLGTIDIQEFLDVIPLDKNSPRKKEFFGEEIKLTSHRYKVYAVKGVQCAHCGIIGTFFAVEQSLTQNTKKYHVNLYGINGKGEEVMITIDHIIPKAKGGNESIDNKQPLCFKCNNKKGDKLPETEFVKQKT